MIRAHFLCKHEGGEGEECCGVGGDPGEVAEDSGGVACGGAAGGVDGVKEGQGVCDFFKHAADELRIEPDARQPGRKVRQKRAAEAADLFIVQAGSAKHADGDEQKRRRKQHDKRQKKVRTDGKAEAHTDEQADRALRKADRDERQDISHQKLPRRHRRGEQAQHQRARAVARHEHSRKQRNKRKPEHRNAGRQLIDTEQFDRNIRLDQRQQKQHDQREPEAESKIKFIAQHFFCAARGKTERFSHDDPPIQRQSSTKASSKLALFVFSISSRGVPTATRRPCAMTPTRSQSASASSR